jgi:hypothetical protein
MNITIQKVEEEIRSADGRHWLLIATAAQKEIELYQKSIATRGLPNVQLVYARRVIAYTVPQQKKHSNSA